MEKNYPFLYFLGNSPMMRSSEKSNKGGYMIRPLPILPVIIGVFLLGFAAHRITASENPALITTFCERKNGDIYAINDGYSTRTSCLGRDRLVSLGGGWGVPGPTGPAGATGATGPKYALPEHSSVGFIGYVAGDSIYVLNKNKKIYYQDNTTNGWIPMETTNRWPEPWDVPLDIENISDFKLSYFIDTNGDVWKFFAHSPEDRGWINIGQP